MIKTIMIIFGMILFFSSHAEISDTSKKYYPFKNFGYNYKGGILYENNQWRIIDSIKNITSDSYDGLFPLFSIVNDDTTLSKVIICENCRMQLKNYNYKLKSNAQHIQIKPDPSDEFTWYDSLDSNGEKVYHQSQYLEKLKIQFSGRKQESALLTWDSNLSLSKFFYSIDFFSPSKNHENFIQVNDLKNFQIVPIIDLEDSFLVFDTIGTNSFSLLTPKNELIKIVNINSYSNSYGKLFFLSKFGNENILVNRKGEKLNTKINWDYEVLCNGHIVTDTNKYIKGECISAYSVSTWIKPALEDRDTWFDSIVEYTKPNSNDYYCYSYFPTQGDLGIFDVNENKWKIEPNCDSLIIEYNINTAQNPISYFFPVSFDHKAYFWNFDPKQFCLIISYYYYSKGKWYRYIIEENKRNELDSSPFVKIKNNTDRIELRN